MYVSSTVHSGFPTITPTWAGGPISDPLCQQYPSGVESPHTDPGLPVSTPTVQISLPAPGEHVTNSDFPGYNERLREDHSNVSQQKPNWAPCRCLRVPAWLSVTPERLEVQSWAECPVVGS